MTKDCDFHNETKADNSLPPSSAESPTSSASALGDLTLDLRNNDLLFRRELAATLEEMGKWSVDRVCKFLEEIGCQQYKQVRENYFVCACPIIKKLSLRFENSIYQTIVNDGKLPWLVVV